MLHLQRLHQSASHSLGVWLVGKSPLWTTLMLHSMTFRNVRDSHVAQISPLHRQLIRLALRGPLPYQPPETLDDIFEFAVALS
jgi:hypothetical protein